MSNVLGESLDLVNVVGVGTVQSELDLGKVSEDIVEAEYDPKSYPSLYLRFPGTPLIIVFRSGKYIVSGAKSETDLEKGREKLLSVFHNLGIIENNIDDEFSIVNYVIQGDLQDSVDLHTIALQLGYNHIEYEPEQFPGLVYRPQKYDCVLLIFGSGKVILTGTSEIQNAINAFESLESEISGFID